MDEKRDFGENANQERIIEFERVFDDAEQALRKSMTTLGEWGEQARMVMRNRPGVVLASVSIAGFMTGLLVRQGGLGRERGKVSLSADPIIVFLTGALAGLTLGPRLLREALHNNDEGNVSELDASRRGGNPSTDRGHH